MTTPTSRRALIHGLFAQPMDAAAIEQASLATIDQEAPAHHLSSDQWQVVRRMVHTTADFSLIPKVRFSPDAIQEAVGALRRAAPLYVDSHMIRAGLSLSRLLAVSPDYKPEHIVCHVADPEVAELAGTNRLPRSLYAVRKARDILHGGIAVFGNAPVALLELNRLILEEGLRPALVVGMPVGFVHVVESKQELISLNVPHVVLTGRRGGSPLAVSVIHALCNLAQTKQPDKPKEAS